MADQSDVQSRTASPQNQSLGEILQNILHDMEKIVQAETRLARAEIVQKIQQVKGASVFLGIAAICGALGAACFVTTCIAALALVMPVWLAALLMGIGLCCVAGGAFVAGRTRVEKVDPIPRQTVETLKDDLEWTKRHIA